MIRFFKHFVIFVTICVFTACQKSTTSKIIGNNIPVTDSIKNDTAVESFVTPYRTNVNKTLDSALCYNPTNLFKKGTPLNTAIGNWMADETFEAVAPIFESRTGEKLDFVLLNYGGIRAGLNKGNLSARNAYEIMPFENMISVIEINSANMQELIGFLAKSQRAHPISKQLNIAITKDGEVKKVLLNEKPLDTYKTFKIATSDYLANLGDNMSFFKNPVKRTDLNYLIRNIFIDAFKKTDTIKTQYDNRFIYDIDE